MHALIRTNRHIIIVVLLVLGIFIYLQYRKRQEGFLAGAAGALIFDGNIGGGLDVQNNARLSQAAEDSMEHGKYCTVNSGTGEFGDEPPYTASKECKSTCCVVGKCWNKGFCFPVTEAPGLLPPDWQLILGVAVGFAPGVAGKIKGGGGKGQGNIPGPPRPKNAPPPKQGGQQTGARDDLARGKGQMKQDGVDTAAGNIAMEEDATSGKTFHDLLRAEKKKYGIVETPPVMSTTIWTPSPTVPIISGDNLLALNRDVSRLLEQKSQPVPSSNAPQPTLTTEAPKDPRLRSDVNTTVDPRKKDWEYCANSAECANGCCSVAYSNDKLQKCHPKDSGGCI